MKWMDVIILCVKETATILAKNNHKTLIRDIECKLMDPHKLHYRLR